MARLTKILEDFKVLFAELVETLEFMALKLGGLIALLLFLTWEIRHLLGK